MVPCLESATSVRCACRHLDPIRRARGSAGLASTGTTDTAANRAAPAGRPGTADPNASPQAPARLSDPARCPAADAGRPPWLAFTARRVPVRLAGPDAARVLRRCRLRDAGRL